MRSLLLALALSPVWAQWPKFDVQSRVVTVPVAVTDAQSRTVEGLEAGDFVLLEDGRPRKFSMDTFGTGTAPIALVVAVQTSGISLAALEKVRKIGSMIQPLVTGEQGCAGVIAFAGNVEWRQQCTGDSTLISTAFARLQPGEVRSGRMLDAALEGIRALRNMERKRRVLLLISESRDRGSETDLETVVKEAQLAAVTVCAVTYSPFGTAFTSKTSPLTRVPIGIRRSTPGQHEPGAPLRRDRLPAAPPPEQRVDLSAALEELGRLSKDETAKVLAGLTGGALLEFGRQKGLEDAIEKVGAELHGQYVLNFVPEATDGYHRLEVKVQRAGMYGIRARPGYWAGVH